MARIRHSLATAMIFLAACSILSADPAVQKPTPEQLAGFEFFENHIRPVLIDKCFDCHSQSSDSIEGGLELDTAAGLIRGGDSGAVINREKIDDSRLLQAISHADSVEAMPPEEKLDEEVVVNFRRWIEMGAPDPRDIAAPTSKDVQHAQRMKHWAFHTPQASAPPSVNNPDWPRTDLDAFVLAEMEGQGIVPAADASRRTLIRRLYFDLIGLPPTPEDIKTFLADPAEDAVDRLADRLLASDRFGERWARHWLDVVRYAESSGKEFNFTYPHAWPYRDYVIAAFNDDKPYNEFIREQMAGDLMAARPYESREDREARLIATSVLSFGTKRHNSSGDDFYMGIVDDQIDTTSRAVLGLTVACAKCHDHKFDPIPTKDYYALAGIFRSTDPLYGTIKQKYSNSPTDLLPIGPEGQAQHDALMAHREMVAAVEKPRDAKKSEIAAAEKTKKEAEQKKVAAEKKIADAKSAEKPDDSASKKELADALAAIKDADGKLPTLKKQLVPLEAAVAELKKKEPPTPRYAMMVRDNSKPSDTKIAIRGNIRDRGDVAPRGFLTAMRVKDAKEVNPQQSGRLELADWMTSRHNPLTARVIVNRVWHHLFGRGIVETVDNFGIMGSSPTHEQLLDTLAVEFMEDGWSVKRLIRRIVTSRTYQLSCAVDSKNIEIDPANRFLWRSSPRRLPVEVIRDAVLAVSGKLDLQPPIGSTVTGLGDQMVRGVPTDKLQPPSNCRSVYLPVVRDYASKMFDRFDFPSSALVSGKRAVTNTPAQALFMRNSKFIAEQSENAAKRVLNEHKESDDSDRVDIAMKWMFGRASHAEEKTAALELLKSFKDSKEKVENPETVAWQSLFESLFATAEFRYLSDVEDFAQP